MTLDTSILFSTPKITPWVSKLISLVTKSPVGHVAIAFYDETLEQRLVLESWWFGFRIINYNQWIKINRKLGEFVLPNYNFEAPLKELSKNIGTSYEYRTFFFAGLDSILSRMGVQLKPVQTPNTYICSESVLRLLKLAGVPDVMHLENEATDPGELYRIAKNSSEFVEIK